MPTVAITDYTFANLDIEKSILDPLAQVISGQCKSPETLIELVQNADAVITQFAPVNAAEDPGDFIPDPRAGMARATRRLPPLTRGTVRRRGTTGEAVCMHRRPTK